MNYSISEDKLNKLIYRTIDNIIDKQSIKSTSNLKFQNEDVLTKITYHYENYDELAALYFENHFQTSSGPIIIHHLNELNEIKEILSTMSLYLGMEIPNWPPDNIVEMSKKFTQNSLAASLKIVVK